MVPEITVPLKVLPDPVFPVSWARSRAEEATCRPGLLPPVALSRNWLFCTRGVTTPDHTCSPPYMLSENVLFRIDTPELA